MYRLTVLSVGLLAWLVLLGVRSVKAEEGKPSWQMEWEKTVQAAEEEGTVSVYASSSVGNLRVVWKAFQKEYPKIKLTSAVPGRGSQVIVLLMAERRAHKYLADVILAAPTTIYESFYRAKILEPIPPALILPEVKDVSQWWQGKHRYIDPEGQYTFMYEGSLYGPPISYNTNLVKPGEIKSVWDALDKKWKGKFEALDIVGRGQSGSTALIFMYYHPEVGPKFIEKVYSEMDATLFRNFRQATDRLARGRFALCVLCRGEQEAREQGLPVARINPYDLREKPGIGAANGALALPTGAPHPNAARVFTNWYLSREGQIAFRKANIDNDRKTSLREDLPPGVVPDMARRRKGRGYVFINRADWMDFKPIRKLIVRATRKRAQR